MAVEKEPKHRKAKRETKEAGKHDQAGRLVLAMKDSKKKLPTHA